MPAKPERSTGELLEEAYNYGLEEGEGGDPSLIEEEAENEEEALEVIYRGWDGYTQGAHYANTVLPNLRRLAGYEDSGHGTYQVCPDEQTSQRHSDLVDSFREGWVDQQLAQTKWG